MATLRANPVSPARVLLRWLPAAIAAGGLVALALGAITLLLAMGSAPPLS